MNTKEIATQYRLMSWMDTNRTVSRERKYKSVLRAKRYKQKHIFLLAAENPGSGGNSFFYLCSIPYSFIFVNYLPAFFIYTRKEPICRLRTLVR